MNQRRWNGGVAIFGSLTVVLLLIGLFWPVNSSEKDVVASTTTSTTTTASTTTVPLTPDSECLNSWGRSDTDKAGNRWVAEGIPSISEAKTEEEARAAAQEWMAVVRKDPATFRGAIRWSIHKDVAAEELFDDSGCATAKAVDLLADVQTAFALSAFKPEEAPETGYNSGADPNGGGVHVAGAPGIKGDRTSVRIDLPDGTTIWVLARCGNPVTMSPPAGIPQGPTDNNPPAPVPPGTTTPPPPGETTSTTTTRPTTSTTRPTTTTTIVVCPPDKPHGTPPLCKDSPSRDPQQQGNNRPGGGGTAPPVPGPATPPAAGPPPSSYTPPTRPTVPTTRPTGSTAPPSPTTTVPSKTDPEVTAPPVTGDPSGF